MKALMICSDEASDKAIAIWNHFNRAFKARDRVSHDDRLTSRLISRLLIGAGGQCVGNGPLVENLLQNLLS